jgi:hypothetical protein
MLGALEDRNLSRNCYRIAWKYDIEIERRAVHLAAGHTVADTDAIRLPARFEPHLAASAAAFIDFICHVRS